MKQSKALADTYILLAGSSITRTTRPGEQFSRVEPERQIKPLKREQGYVAKRLIFILVLGILLLSLTLPIAA
jgi:hypothetical protein